MTVKCSEAQGLSREARPERSVEQIHGLTHRNRIQGRRTRTSGHMTTKSKVIKGYDCRSGGRVEKVVELTSGDLHAVLKTRLGALRSVSNAMQKSAEGILVSFKRASAEVGKQR